LCRKTSPLVPSSPTPQLPTPFDDRQIDRHTDPPTDPPIKPTTRFGSSRHLSATFAEAHGLGLTALIGDLVLISSRRGRHGRLGQPADRRAPASRFCFFQPDYWSCIGCTPSMGPCSYRYMCMRIPIASEPYSLVKPCRSQSPTRTVSLVAVWRSTRGCVSACRQRQAWWRHN
jgi:hypothetical protein